MKSQVKPSSKALRISASRRLDARFALIPVAWARNPIAGKRAFVQVGE